MSKTLSCPACGQPHTITDEFLGKRVACVSCAKQFDVPPRESSVQPSAVVQAGPFDSDFEFEVAQTEPMAVLPFVVEQDLACRRCKYNLRGLNADGKCPECGTPVAMSLQKDLIGYSDPDWIRMLRRGATGIIAAFFVMIAGFAAIVAIVFFMALAHAGTVGYQFRNTGQIAGLAGYIVYVISIWLLTSPDPSGLGEDRYGRSRRLIRGLIFVGILKTLCGSVAEFIAMPELSLINSLVGTLGSIASVIGTVAFFNYLSKLSERLPDAYLAERCRTVMYGIGVSLGGMTGVQLLLQLHFAMVRTIGGPGPAVLPTAVAGAVAGGCIIMVLGIVALVYSIIGLVIVWNFRNKVRIVEEWSRANWAASANQ